MDVMLRFLWGIACMFLGVFNIDQDLNVPLIVQPQLFSFIALVSLFQVRTDPILAVTL